ncbi:hypothetical protein A2772_02120 [Candidatus Daviesbacteria bacterium RIFCSPHIGHO2_01_FULL_38_8b]|nr:MAG: hypothetical protein A2772_02120 [Candidatus Daviesbacteria bacterium RIFCSPHIGHO2_01_FULL_38_8b]
MARIPEILERAGKPFLTAAILFVPGCAPKAEPLPIVREVIATATAIPCDPEKYAASIGIPTPVPVGDSAAPEEMVLISRKVWACEPLSDAERDAFIKFGIAHPLLATPDPVRQLIPTSTPAPAPELARKPENFLPEYAVYYGQMKQENGTGTGSVIIANIPGRSEWLYAFSMANRDIGGYIFRINKLDANNLEASGSLGMVNTTLAEDGKTLSGIILWKRNNTSWRFDIQQYGTGKVAIIEAAKKLWDKEIANDPTLWQKVPEKTILDSMFDGKGIPLP